MDLGMQGKVALVTGASTGIGFATAAALAQEGAVVVGVSLRLPESPTPDSAPLRRVSRGPGAGIPDRSAAAVLGRG